MVANQLGHWEPQFDSMRSEVAHLFVRLPRLVHIPSDLGLACVDFLGNGGREKASEAPR